MMMGCLIFCLGLAARSGAQTVTLQAAADSTLKQSPANQNRGSDPTLQLAGDGRVLVRFDQTAISAAVGSGRLVSASLELFVHSANGSWGPDGRPIEAHLVTAGWTEAGVTWNCAIDTSPANNKPDCATRWDGGSFDDDATDSVVETAAEHVWVPFDVTADVATFLGGTPNQGWLIVKADDDQSGKADYGSREGTAAERPRLVLLVESAAHDQVPPSLAITSPGQPILVNDPAPAVVVEYADGGSGVDLATLQVLVDGQDVTPSCTPGPQTASCRAPTLATGNHSVQARLTDHAGNAAQASAAFQLLLGPGPHLVTLQTVGDTYLRKGDANKNFGTEPILRVREGGQNRALVQFDGASLASTLRGATVVSAALELHVEKNGRNWGKTGRTVDAHRLTAAWTETGATWNCPNDSNPTNDRADCAAQWAGGSFAATPTASVLHTRDLTGWVHFDVTADVAAFATGAPDFGWLLKKTNEKQSGRMDYDSRQGTAGEGPRLVVVFTTPTTGDTTPPTVTIIDPGKGSFVGTAIPLIRASYSDVGSGIDITAVRVLVDGVDRTAEAAVASSSLELTPVSPLAAGGHTVSVQVRDVAGNAAQDDGAFTVDTTPPSLAVTAPAGPVVDNPSPAVALSFSDAAAGVAAASLRVQVDGVDVTASCTVGTATATCLVGPLAAGSHDVEATIEDGAGNRGMASRTFALLLDQTAPSLGIVRPAALVSGEASPAIELHYSDAESGVDPASLRVEVDGTALAGCAAGPAVATCTPSPLSRGRHSLTARIADVRGNFAQASLDFAVIFPLTVAFVTPQEDSVSPTPVVRVTGTVSAGATAVMVNGVAATLAAGTFAVDSLGLHDGANTLVAVARDVQGNVGTAAIRVFADTVPPQISITSPAGGAQVTTPAVTVTGLVNDLTIGTISESEVAVTVNGLPATVANRSFLVAGVPLAPGSNRLTATATDRAGNRNTATVEVVLESRTGVPTLAAVAGDGQTAPILTALPQPLVVEVRDGAGQPLVGAQVVYRVVQGNGTLAGGNRLALVTTDGQGRAAVSWTLGSRAGVATHRVRATAVGVVGDVSFLAVVSPGPAAAIHPLSGNDQRGAVGDELARPLIAVVFDAGGNALAGVPVTFRSQDGGGKFGGAESAVVTTDRNGQAAVRLRLGPAPGLDNHLIEASFSGLANQPAGFKASSFLPGDPASTRITGVVVDNQGAPVPGVTLRLRDSTLTTVTDGQGQFRLSGVPVGRVFVIADASTATRPGTWASLEYELFTLPGVENTLDRPIYLLPLDLPHGVLVDEIHGGTVTLPEVPGFALDIAPGSVTFPGGGRSGVISVTAVHADRIPMAPGAGMQPRLIVTIQPAGALFDPPAAMTLPNTDGLAPGTVTELFSFDHELGAFVAIGTGTVSEDGAVLRSDPGFGVLKAGWHCGSPPGGSGASATLGVSITTPPPVLVCRDEHNQPVPRAIQATGGPPLDAEYSWDIGDGGIATLSPSGGGLCRDQTQCDTRASAGAQPGRTQATVTIRCTTTGATMQDQIDVVNPGVVIDSVNICGNQIQTRLLPDGANLNGQLTLRMVGADGSRSVFFQAQRAAGTYTDTFNNFNGLPRQREFTQLEAVWHVGDCDVVAHTDAHFMYLGNIRHTQYNCPSSGDGTCAGGGQVSACFTDAGCHYQGPDNVPGRWVNQVTNPAFGTGCGSTPTRGNVQIEAFCLRGHPPTGACLGASIFRAGGGITAHCGGGVNTGTVAVSPAWLASVLPCGSNLCIMLPDGGVQKTVTDRCPACGTTRIDNFSDSGACGIGDLAGSAPTLRLY